MVSRMAYYLRKFKKTDECECAPCEAPMTPPSGGIGDAVPCMSGDRWDNVFGGPGWGGTVSGQRKRKYKVKGKRKNG